MRLKKKKANSVLSILQYLKLQCCIYTVNQAQTYKVKTNCPFFEIYFLLNKGSGLCEKPLFNQRESKGNPTKQQTKNQTMTAFLSSI